jgi:hypothetical protein
VGPLKVWPISRYTNYNLPSPATSTIKWTSPEYVNPLGLLWPHFYYELVRLARSGRSIWVVSPNLIMAGVRMGLVILGLVAVPIALGLVWPTTAEDRWHHFMNHGVNPVGAWSGALFSRQDYARAGAEFFVKLQTMGLGITLYVLAAFVFALLAWWRLEKGQRRG